MAQASRGELLRLLGRPDEAKDALERSMRTDLSTIGEEYPLTSLGHILAASGKPEQAIPLFERALQAEASRKIDVDEVAETRFALASALWSTGGDRARALNLARAASEMYARLRMSAEGGEVDAWLAKHERNRKRP
jgi:tetratricopeptide (TPR) repeat protein